MLVEFLGRTPDVVEKEIAAEAERQRIIALKKKESGRDDIKTAEQLLENANTPTDYAQTKLVEPNLRTCVFNKNHGDDFFARIEGRTAILSSK